MQGWLESDEHGRQCLVRTGTGVVTAVVPLDLPDPNGRHVAFRVEIYCDAPHGRPGAIRYSAHPMVASGDPLLGVARQALDEVWAVEWTVRWHRHDWIPPELSISSLNLATDATASLVALERVVLPEPDELVIPDYLPASWDRT